MTTCGYFGVIIPDYNYYQGFFLHEAAIKKAPDFLESLRKEIISFSEVRNPVPGVPDKDQALLGALCAALVEGARTQSESILLHVGGALSLVMHHKYFVVRGDIDQRGIGTQIWRMPPEINSPDAARDYIHSLPEVQLIQGKLLKEAADQVLNDRKKH